MILIMHDASTHYCEEQIASLFHLYRMGINSLGKALGWPGITERQAIYQRNFFSSGRENRRVRLRNISALSSRVMLT